MAESLFSTSTNTQAKLKAGFQGFAGSGKTFTATTLMIGLIHYMRKLELAEGNKPLYFIDTETGSDWLAPIIRSNAIELRVLKSRAFKDLIPAVREAEEQGAGLIVDSITHFWTEFVEAYKRRKNRTRLEFQDWGWLKPEWAKFTDVYVNSNLHMIICGRAGYEYEYNVDEDTGKKELQKSGVRMKAESEIGFEPSLLIMMERNVDPRTLQVHRTANVLKDRSTLIDGQAFNNPTFETFLPHIQFLNLGGTQMGVDLSRTSESMVGELGSPERPSWKYEQEQKEILLEKIQALFVKADLSGQSKEGKKEIMRLLERHFHTTSWKEVEGYTLGVLKHGHDALAKDLFPDAPSNGNGATATSGEGEVVATGGGASTEATASS
jgi:hypothetical protein